MKKLTTLTILTLLLPYLAWGAQNMECKTYELKVHTEDSKVVITLPIFNDSSLIFGGREGTGAIGPHDSVVVTFDSTQCTALEGNLITCAGVPQNTLVAPYWSGGQAEAMEMDRVAIQLREVQALSILDGQPYEMFQVKISGHAKGKKGGSALVEIKKSCH